MTISDDALQFQVQKYMPRIRLVTNHNADTTATVVFATEVSGS